MLEDDTDIKVQNLGMINPESAQAKTTVLAHDRLQRLVEKVEKDDFILRVDVPGFFLVSWVFANLIFEVNCRASGTQVALFYLCNI